jgi:hypothetical protein
MLFGRRATLTPYVLPPSLRDICLVTEIKILGVTLNNLLTYDTHIATVRSKLAMSVAMLLKLKLAGYPQRTLLSAYQSLFVPHLSYCVSVRGLSVKALIKPLQIQ